MTEDAPERHRSRVSLLNLLVLTAVAALAATVAVLWGEIVPLRAELQRLRDEVGDLTISDPSKLHAIRVVKLGDELTWRWRLWVPEGKTYRLHFIDRDIPAKGVPAGGGSITVRESGEQTVRLRVQRNATGDGWGATLSTRSGSLRVGGSNQAWAGEPRVSSEDGVTTATRSFGAEDSAVLLRFRTAPVDDASGGVPDPADGFLLWLEPL